MLVGMTAVQAEENNTVLFSETFDSAEAFDETAPGDDGINVTSKFRELNWADKSAGTVEWTDEENRTGEGGTVKITLLKDSPSWANSGWRSRMGIWAKLGTKSDMGSVERSKQYKVSAWVKGAAQNTGTTYMPICLRNNWEIGLNGNNEGTVDKLADNVSVGGTGSAVSNKWQQYSFVIDGSKLMNDTWYIIMANSNGNMNFKAGDIFYIDDIKVEALGEIELMGSSLNEDGSSYLYAGDGFTVDFNKTPNVKSEITVIDPDGEKAEITKKVSNDSIKVQINDIKSGQYTVKLGRLYAANGSEYVDMNGLTYTFTADADVFMKETFDNGVLGYKKYSYATIEESDEEDHTTGNGKSMKLTVTHDIKRITGYGWSEVIGASKSFDNFFPKESYYISAWIKGGETFSSKDARLRMSMGKYSTKDTAETRVTNEWSKITLFFAAEDANAVSWKITNVLGGDGVPNDFRKDDVIYIDDIEVVRVTEMDCVGISLTDNDRQKLYMNGEFSAEFTMVPDADKSEITVTDSNGNKMNITKTVWGAKIIVKVADRKDNETYHVHFGTVYSASGKNSIDLDKDYTFVSDMSTVMNESFADENSSFASDKLEDRAWFTDKENHTSSIEPGDASGAITLNTFGDESNDYAYSSKGSMFGVRRSIGSDIMGGQTYLVSAYVKAEPGRYNELLPLQIGVYKDANSSAEVSGKFDVTSDWQQIGLLWSPSGTTTNYRNYLLRINLTDGKPFHGGLKGDNKYDIYYFDDINIKLYQPLGVVGDDENYLQNNAVNVGVGNELKVKFTKTIDKESFKDVYAVLTDADKQTVACDIEIDNDVLKLKPRQPLSYGAKYTLTLGKNISETVYGALYGMKSDVKITFTTQGQLYDVVNYSADDTKVSFSVSNNTDTQKDVDCVLVQYNDKKAEKISAQSVTVPANGSSDTITFAPEGFNKDNCELIITDSLTDEAVSYFLGKTASAAARNSEAVTAEAVAKTTLTAAYDSAIKTVTVKGQTAGGAKNVPILVRILAKDKALSDASAEDFARYEVVETADGGAFGYSFNADGMSGSYTVYANVLSENKAVKAMFSCAEASEINAALTKLNNATAQNAVSVFGEVCEILSLTSESYDKLANKAFVAKSLAEKGKYASAEEAQKEFNAIVEIVLSFETADKTAVEKFIKEHESFGIGNTSAYQVFEKDMHDEKKAEVIKALAQTEKLSALPEKFNGTIIIGELKAYKTVDSIYTILSKFSDILKIDSTTYKALTTSGKNTVCTKFSSEIPGLQTTDEIVSKFNTLVKTQKTSESDSKGSGKGSGSYGGSGNSSSSDISGITVPKNSNDVKTPDWYEDPNKQTEITDDGAFDDIGNVSWAKDSILRLHNLGVINGKAEKQFCPNDNITRAEAAKMMVKALKLVRPDESKGEMTFTDVDKTAWYYEDVLVCWEYGILNGVDSANLGVNSTLTREEFSTIICRAAEAGGYMLDNDITLFPFNDKAEISDWAVKSVEILRESDIIDGIGNNVFAPKDKVTRAQAAKIINSLLTFSY